MPKLWKETIEAHRREVRDAVLDATAALVTEHGLLAVTMSRIAEETGIGRGTLYRYFPGVAAILGAWHERLIGEHLKHLAAVRDRARGDEARLRAVLEAYALMLHDSQGHYDTELAPLLHQGAHLVRGDEDLRAMVRDVLAEAGDEGAIRSDVGPDELATYCLYALAAARTLSSKAAVGRLVSVTLGGLGAVERGVGPRA